MKKRKLLLAAMTAAALSVFISGCGAGNTAPETTTGTTAETTTETEATSDTGEGQESESQAPIVTPGIFKSQETIGENEIQASFVDENGIEFIANISDMTQTSGELEEGKTYLISHSEVMTMSMPGIYPQVYEIKPSDTPLETKAPEESRPTAPEGSQNGDETSVKAAPQDSKSSSESTKSK